jgi:hypothetical protein
MNMVTTDVLQTKKVPHLEPEYFGKRENRRGPSTDSMTYQLLRALDDLSRTDMEPGFVVDGEGRKALENTFAILVQGQTARNSFEEGNEISAVLFTRVIGYMHLMQIEKTGSTITISYCLEPTAGNPIVSPKIALIPLGKLPSGEYQVEMAGFTKKPDDRKSDCEPIPDDRMKKLICQPFEFTIMNKGANETTHPDK